MVNFLRALLGGTDNPVANPQQPVTAPVQSAAPMSNDQRKGLLGLGGNLGGFMDFNDPQTLIALQLISNGSAPPGDMLGGIGQIQRMAFDKQREKDAKAEEQRQKNMTAEWLKSNAPQYAPLVEAGIMSANQAYEAFSRKEPVSEYQQRMQALDAYGGELSDDQRRSFVLTGKMPEGSKPMSSIGKLQADYAAGVIDDQQYQQALAGMAPKGMTLEVDGEGGYRFTQGAPALTATDKKAMWAAEDELPLYDNTIASLEQAKALNTKTFTGTGAGLLGTIGTNFPGAGIVIDRDKAEATSEFNKLMSMEAIQAMAQTLKGATTDAELERFVSILADPATDPDIRGRTIDRMLTLAQRQKEIKVNRINELRGNSSGMGATGTKQRLTYNPATGLLE